MSAIEVEVKELVSLIEKQMQLANTLKKVKSVHPLVCQDLETFIQFLRRI